MAYKNLTLTALKDTYEDCIFYVGIIKAKKLFGLTEVSRVDDDPAVGYQRLLGKDRAKKIAAYVDSGYLLPGALVLSAQEGSIKKYDPKTHKLTLSSKPKSLLVIDGQHRLYGAFQANNDLPIPIFIFDNLQREEEVQYFLDVNGLQRGVPKTLRLELTKFTAAPESKEDILLRLFKELDENLGSPLSGKMTRTKSMSGKISHVAFQSAIGVIIEKSPLAAFTFEQKVSILINYLQAVEEILLNKFGNINKISNSAFFQSIMYIFIDVCDQTYRRYENYKKESLREILDPIANIDFDLFKGTNKKAIKEFGDEMRMNIIRDTNVSDDLF